MSLKAFRLLFGILGVTDTVKFILYRESMKRFISLTVNSIGVERVYNIISRDYKVLFKYVPVTIKHLTLESKDLLDLLERVLVTVDTTLAENPEVSKNTKRVTINITYKETPLNLGLDCILHVRARDVDELIKLWTTIGEQIYDKLPEDDYTRISIYFEYIG